MGADIVIASNVMVPPEERNNLDQRSKTLRRRFAKKHPILNFLNQTFNPFPLAVDFRCWIVVYRLGRHAGSLSA